MKIRMPQEAASKHTIEMADFSHTPAGGGGVRGKTADLYCVRPVSRGGAPLACRMNNHMDMD